ncbi:hypothetical protein [Pontibacter sp. G13]|uniref:hypothetical protein n=1 Tax=Pontibacter sp. G13 TaxID=3074898 RepID=UPI00288987B7|nr:hypothetical protein [Pontibacter sp. G13]WNJ20085.1 hypothetical protein RJD25_06335 [Pontibacter sp. G13]
MKQILTFMRASILTILLLMVAMTGQAQPPAPDYSVKSFSFMIGTWQGEGWIMGRDRTRKTFQQTETIQPKANMRALQVEGLGYATDSTGVTDRVIHDAFGIISYNPAREGFTMLAFSDQGGRMECDFKQIGDKKLQWSFMNPGNGGYVRFTEDFSTEGVWVELGEFSRDGAQWFPFFQMKLIRQESE